MRCDHCRTVVGDDYHSDPDNVDAKLCERCCPVCSLERALERFAVDPDPIYDAAQRAVADIVGAGPPDWIVTVAVNAAFPAAAAQDDIATGLGASVVEPVAAAVERGAIPRDPEAAIPDLMAALEQSVAAAKAARDAHRKEFPR